MRVWFSSLILIAIYVSTTFFGVALGDTTCGTTCAGQITQITTCGNTNNLRCMCQDYDYATKYRGCVQKTCNQDDLLLVVKNDGRVCANAGFTMTQPGPDLTPLPPLPPPTPTTNLPAPPDNTNNGDSNSGGGNTGGSALVGTDSAGSSMTVGKGFSLVTTLGVVMLVVL